MASDDRTEDEARTDRIVEVLTEAFVQQQDIDVLALQETKARDDQWPVMGLEAMGYQVARLCRSSRPASAHHSA